MPDRVNSSIRPPGPQDHVPALPGITQPGAPQTPPRHESWHWRSPDPLVAIYGNYPWRLLIHDHVGLDVGSAWLKYAVTRHGIGSPRLLSAGAVPILAQGVGQVNKLRAQIAALLTVRESVPRGSERWVVGLSGPGTVVRTVEVPRMPRRELHEAVLWVAQKKIPFPLAEAHVAIQYLGSGPHQPVRAVVSAAVKRLVDHLLYLLAEAEIKPAAITLPAFGLERLLATSGHGEPGVCCGLLDIGAERSLFAVYRGEEMEFYREIDLGVGDVEEALAGELRQERPAGDLDPRRPDQVLFEQGFGSAEESLGDDPTAFLATAMEKLLLEIQNTLEYYSAQLGGIRISRFLLLGGGAEIPGLDRYLSRVLDTPVELFSPLRRGPDRKFALDDRLLAASRWAGAYAYSLLPRSVANLLPAEHVREQEALFRSRLWRRATGTAVAASLFLSGAEYYRGHLAVRQADDLQMRLSQTLARIDELGGPDLHTTLSAHKRWRAALARQDARSSAVLRWFSNHTPQGVALDRVEMRPGDSGFVNVDVAGEVRTTHDQNEVILAGYVESLMKSGYFDHVTLEQYGTTRRPDYEQLVFHLTMRAPLEERTP
jgi:type IV pilus assembly protein PilM